MELLKRISPEQAGVDPKNLTAFFKEVADPEMGLNSFVAVRNGSIIGEAYWAPYAKEKPHVLYSASKSFTGLSALFAAQDGLLSLEDRVVDFFPERLPAKHCENMEKMRIRDLLTMSTGFEKDPHDFDWPRPDDILATGPHCCHNGVELPRNDWIRNFFHHYVAYEPGTEFVYCTHGSFMLSCCVEKAVGMNVSAYMNEKLFKPLGIGEPFWEANPDGHTVGGWGLMLTAEQLALVGQWMLQKGKWNGVQLLDEKWIEEASSVQMLIGNTKEDHIAGYGYQMWIGEEYGTYFFRGAFGQILAIVPEKNMAFAYTGANGKPERQKIWEAIVKYIIEPAKDEKLVENTVAQAALDEITAEMNIPVQQGEDPMQHPELTAFGGKRFVFGDNRLNYTSAAVGFENGCTLTLGLNGREFTVPVGYGEWKQGETCVKNEETDTDISLIFRSVSCSGAWVDGHYVIKACFDETNYINTFDFFFAGNAVILKHSRNNSFYDAVNCTITGVEA